MKYIIFIYIVILAFIGACKPDLEEFTPSNGDADFTYYVSVGNSLTAGFSGGDLYITGQLNSYPNILSNQFKNVGGGEFLLPLMKDDLGFGNKKILGFSTDCLGETSLAPIASPGTPDPGNFIPIGSAGPYNNLGVPGAKSFHLLFPGYGTLNPYYGRFASNPATSSIIGEAAAQNPSFFSLWIGNNDVLSYGLAGGAQDSITNPVYFEGVVTAILQALTNGGAKGVIANLPEITNVPFFTTIPYNGLVLSNQAQVDALNFAYQPLGIIFALGANPFIIQDATAPGGVRQMAEGELVLLTTPQDSLKCGGWGSQKPIAGNYILDLSEVSDISSAIGSYNNSISTLAQQYSLAFVDMNKYFKEAKSGLIFDGLTFNTTFVTGGFFSLDGIHPTPQGYAIIANFFIEAINAKYGSQVPLVNVTEYPGIVFP